VYTNSQGTLERGAERLMSSLVLKPVNLSSTQRSLVLSQWGVDDGIHLLVEEMMRLFPAEVKTALVGVNPPAAPEVVTLRKELDQLRSQLALAGFQGGKGGGTPRFSSFKKCRICDSDDHKYGEGVKCGAELAQQKADGWCGIHKKKGLGHWTRDCPLYDPNYFRNKGNKKAALFVGVAFAFEGSHGSPSGLLAVTEECLKHNAGVHDSGSAGTVGGTTWLAGYEATNGDLLREEGTEDSFGFGAGGEKAVKNSVVLQLKYGTTTYPLRVNIVEGDLPLLISRVDQEAMDGVTRSKKHLFCLPAPDGAETAVPLVISESGHWLIPLKWRPSL
jgi:hypothetical protein